MISQDWRLQGQDWLREELLGFEPYRPRPGRLRARPLRVLLAALPFPAGRGHREGWVTHDRRWICETCYEDFKLMFEWVLET